MFTPLQTRILFVCHDGALYGSQQSLKLIIENLPPERYQCHVSFAKPGPLMDLLAALPNVLIHQHPRIALAKHNKRTGLKRLKDQLNMLLNVPRVLTLCRLIRQYKIDVVHTNSLVSFEGAFAAWVTRTPHIWHQREVFTDYHPRFHLIWGRRITSWLVQHLSVSVPCISRYVQQQYQPYVDKMPQHYPVIYNAIQSLHNPPQPLPLGPVLQLLYAALASDSKRFQDIIEALGLLKQHYTEAFPFHLHVYGDCTPDEFAQWVQSHIQQYQLQPHITFYGFQPDLTPAFAQAHLLLMPSSSEPFGRTMLDALAHGRPVLAAQSGAATEVLMEGVTGFFHQPQQPADLAQKLVDIYNQREQLPAMYHACLESVQTRFNSQQQMQTLDALYQQVCCNKV